MPKRIMVTGGTGTIGSSLVKALLKQGAEVVVLTRSAKKARQLPGPATGVVGSFEDIAVLRHAMQGCDALFLNCELGPSELFQGVVAADLAKHAGVGHIVYLSGQGPDSLFLPPHCGVKITTERAIAAMGMDTTFLRPNTFMQNDLNVRDALYFGGRYLLPFGDGGVWRIDTRDIADIAANALLNRAEHAGQTYNLVGSECQTGQSITDSWSSALNRPIQYCGDDLDAFEATLCQLMQPIVAHDIRMIYEHYQSKGLHAEDGDVARMHMLLGRPPRTFKTFCAERAVEWGALPVSAKLTAGVTALKLAARKRVSAFNSRLRPD